MIKNLKKVAVAALLAVLFAAEQLSAGPPPPPTTPIAPITGTNSTSTVTNSPK
jgi:hypothetical protein